MRQIEVEGCVVDILPIIKGLESERGRIAEALGNDYDVIGAALGPEDIVAFAKREEIMNGDDPELSDLEAVYAHFLTNFGPVGFPTPAYSALVDECLGRSISIIPLDMDDETYSELYCTDIGTVAETRPSATSFRPDRA